MISEFIHNNQLPKGFAAIAQQWFIPLANKIRAHHYGASAPYFVAINGCQGSGKSTLCAFLKAYLQQQFGLNVVSMSLDDFYLPKYERETLAKSVHPLLKTRGVPGTHDTSKLKHVLKRLNSRHGTCQIPLFDKAQDNPLPESKWQNIYLPVDIVLFEGWCWGALPQTQNALDEPVNALEAIEDPLGIWRQYVNTRLQTSYKPLYALMDYWLMLKAPSFDAVFNWRLEQEAKLAKRFLLNTDKPESSNEIMDKHQLYRFVQHFQRLTEHCLNTLSPRCDQVLHLNTERQIVSVTNGSKV